MFGMRILFIAGALLAADCAATSAHRIIEGKVLEMTVPPAGSGYYRAFVSTTVAVGKGELIFLIPFFSETQNLPRVGNLCKFEYKRLHVDGWIGKKIQNPRVANVVTRFTCDE